ncbi:MAG: 16S rRNA (guanine(527)-N(7))-methyltransferase RsmG [Chloroflexi bacterium]|nr:MAG: 16S rRNA (guanine(527)-N(7))-methyltransferase RsmG [Chloroflexota bacterium]
MTPHDLLAATARSWGITLSAAQLDQFERYAAELIRWNQHTNLTTIVEPQAIVVRHFLDSLALAQAWAAEPPSSLADIGTGAGFPGLPLKLLWPQLRLLLVESVGKKTEFLQHTVETLALSDVEISTARAEELGQQPRYREQFAAVTARAVAPLNVLAEYCLPLCEVGGLFVAPKSADGPHEAAAARDALERLGGQLVAIHPVQLPGVEERTLVVVRKVQNTPQQYPRRVGIPAKRPL